MIRTILTEQEIDDILSALQFFRDKYRPPAPETKRAMALIEKKLWKLKRAKGKV